MTSNLKNQIDSKPEELKFIKTSELPLEGLSDQQKVALNRRANALLNEGKIEMAKTVESLNLATSVSVILYELFV